MIFEAPSTHNIRRRVAIVGSILIVAPMIVVILAGWAILQRMQHVASSALKPGRPHAQLELSQMAQNLVEACRKYHQAGVDALTSGQSIFKNIGVVRLDAAHMSVWHAKNELTGQSKALQIPLMAAGDANFAPVTSFDQPAPGVDDIVKSTGTPATVFQRLNEQGDMLRVASTLKSANGARAIGTFIPAGGREGESAQALQTVLSGKTYIGKETIGKVSYLTAYQPLKNSHGNVVGMLNTLLPVEQVKSRVQNLATASTSNGDNLRSFILEAPGGNAIESGNDKEGMGQQYLQDLWSRAKQLPAGEIAEYKFQKAARAGAIPKAMTAQFAYVPELNWVVGFTQPERDVQAASVPLAQALVWAMWLLFGAGVAATGLAVRVWLLFCDDLVPRLSGLLDHLRKDAKQLSAAAVELSHRVTPSPSAASVKELMQAIDQITYATNHLMVSAAIESSTSPNGGESIANTADELRTIAQRCRKAAHDAMPETQTAIPQAPPSLSQPANDSNAALRRQTENLLRLAEGVDRTVEVVSAQVGDTELSS